MWTKPWTLQEGFLIGGGLLVAGLALETSVGPVVWEGFRWPVNGIVLSFFLTMLSYMGLLYHKVYAFRFLTTYTAAIPALIIAVVLTLIMGLTRQTVDGTGLSNMLSFWPFVLSSRSRDIPFLLNHLGLFLALVCATLGNADMQRLKMITIEGEPEWRAMDQHHQIVELPIAIELKQFVMEVYDDGSPKRFASVIQILTQSGKNITTTVDVNKPVEVDGWKIYQYGYDTERGMMSQTSILELVSDPWLPLVYTGIFMMLLGALCLFFTARKHPSRH